MNGDQGDSGDFPDLPAGEERTRGRAVGHGCFSFVAQITFSLFYYHRKLHLEENITARRLCGTWKMSRREERAEQRKPHSARARGETHCVPFCSPGTKSWILEVLLEGKMYHKF